jgi:hypothetical protein
MIFTKTKPIAQERKELDKARDHVCEFPSFGNIP